MAQDPPPASNYTGPMAEGTITAYTNCDNSHLETMAKDLRKAFKGHLIGADEYRIIRILSEHDNKQRQQIIKTYATAFGRDLIEDMKEQLGGYFEDLVLALLTPSRLYDAMCIHKAMKGLGTNEDWLIEILCPRTAEEIKELNDSYKSLYEKTLEDSVTGETSGVLQKVLVSMTTGGREQVEQSSVDQAQVKTDAKDLYDAGEGQHGTEEETFNLIFGKRSWGHLREIFQEYQSLAHRDIEDAIKKEFSFNGEKAFLAIARYAKNPHKFTAVRLNDALKGTLANDKDSFLRLIVAHSETDLASVKNEFRGTYGMSLEEFTTKETRGDFRKLLLRIIDPTSPIRRN